MTESKLTFFSSGPSEKMNTELYRILWLKKAGRISSERAGEMIHNARSDLIDIYYNVARSIGQVSQAVRTHRKIDILSDPAELPPPTSKALISLRDSIQQYRRGEITYKELRRMGQLVKALVRTDLTVMKNEIDDTMAYYRKHHSSEFSETTPPAESAKTTEPDASFSSDMLVKKVSDKMVHDDYAG